jgi:chromate transporter
MSDAASPDAGATGRVPIAHIFRAFLTIGATSFGGAIPYLRGSLVVRERWLEDKEFVEMLSISQSLPGLNATNMAVLVGQKLAGWGGATAGLAGMCLPSAVLMYIAGILYRLHGGHPWTDAALKGVAAAAVGLVLSTAVQLGRRSLATHADLVFVALTIVMVIRFHQSVLTTLIAVGLLAILWHRPRAGARAPEAGSGAA